MIKTQDLKRVYNQDRDLAAEIARILGTSLKEITAKKAPAKKAPAKKKPTSSKKKEAPKKAQPATPKKAPAAPATKKDNKNTPKKKAKAQRTVAKEDLVHDRTFVLLRSQDMAQKLTGLKKALETITAQLIAKAKQAENYDLSDEVDQTRDRIIMHLNALKRVAKEVA